MDETRARRHARPALNGAALVLPLLLIVLAPFRAQAESEQTRTHTVYAGQRLGSIAKRYNVSIEALTRANNIRRTDTIRPGQRLVIPSPKDKDGTQARAAAQAASRASRTSSRDRVQAEGRSHRVESGQRLESIARRYGVTVAALCSENGIDEKSVIRPGQSLSIPSPQSARRVEGAGTSKDQGYRAYFRAPKVKGKIDLVSYSQRFTGRVFEKNGKMSAAARAGIARVLGTSGARPEADQRLIRLLVQVSDRFGGRPIRIVSGYRTTSFFEDSKHKLSRAVDFSIPGVPNEALRDYLRTLSNVGVGYYPNSSFVHLDVRPYAAYWVDYAGPGEAPRSSAVAMRRKAEDVHGAEPADTSGADGAKVAPARETQAASTDRETLPATGTSALSGFASDSFDGSRPGRNGTPPFALPKARPTLAPP